MSGRSNNTCPDNGGHVQELCRRIGAKERRRLAALKTKGRDAWFGVGMFGLVGWAVAIPTVAGIALGVWIDHRFPSRYSWTIMGLVLGIGLGCGNAWYWLSRERRKIERMRDEQT